jgi:hypothetical protein
MKLKVLTIDVETSEILEIKEVEDDYVLQPENSTTFEVWAGANDKVGDVYI